MHAAAGGFGALLFRIIQKWLGGLISHNFHRGVESQEKSLPGDLT
jgi:hypothetical protein